ncbi:MAG TPA: tetratricopeptide repeat protein [Rhizomicrobium sp.]|jgi:tetratricopeptide (TPR) repeat protein
MDLRGAQQAAILAFQRGDLAGAEQICREILGRVVQTQQMLGVILAQKGDLPAALTALDAALEISPNAPHIILNRGNTLLLLRQYESALQNFDRVIALVPNDAATLLGRGSALEGLGRLEDAIQSYEKILESDPDSADAACSCGYAYLKIGDAAKALGRFERVLETHPSNARALNGKGLSLDARGQHQEAVSMMEMAIKISPGFAEAWTNRGNILREMGELRLSVESYRQALHLKPKDPTALLGQSLALWYDDDYEAALKPLDDLLTQDPLHAEAWSRRGLILRDLERITEAMECHDRAMELEPAQPDFCINKGLYRAGSRAIARGLPSAGTA